MIIDLPQDTVLTVYFPDGTRLIISSKAKEITVDHVSPKLNQILNSFTASYEC